MGEDGNADDGVFSNYVESHLPPAIVEKLEAGAFRSLCNHLKERSEEVQNIDLMTISGFCRNCLAKWMVVEARTLAAALSSEDANEQTLQSLNTMGYDEAAQYVYGSNYSDWKKRYAKKASDEQMKKYNESKPLHSQFDKELLAPRAEKPAVPTQTKEPSPAKQPSGDSASGTLLSNVCCQDAEDVVPETVPVVKKDDEISTKKPTKRTRALAPYVSPPPPEGGLDFSVAVLTVSDRAFKNEYATGDLSGPAVQEAVQSCLGSLQSPDAKSVVGRVEEVVIVPDEVQAIVDKIQELAGRVDLVLTTGGTGFAPRDVTPEATRQAVDRECPGLMAFVTNECTSQQPLASLSRGTAGIRGKCLVANLPGNPKGVGEIVPVLLPLALHAIQDLKA